MTSVLASAVGPAASVLAFELQADVLFALRDNARRMSSGRFVGLSDRVRRARLALTDGFEFEANLGTAKVVEQDAAAWDFDLVILDGVLEARP
jgi:tRNA A58 N-methylase Trm61